jgi:hypothetical protein
MNPVVRFSPFAVRYSPFAVRRSPFAVRRSPELSDSLILASHGNGVSTSSKIMRLPIALLALLFLLCGCGNRMEIGRLEYYHQSPRTPSVPDIGPEGVRDPPPGFTALWSVLGIVRPDGPIMKPVSIRIGGKTYPVVGWKYRLHEQHYYYLFSFRGPPGKGFPHDWGTGNLFAQEPATRTRNPIEVRFIRQHDQSTWIGVGTVEQSSLPGMEAAMDFIGSDSR